MASWRFIPVGSLEATSLLLLEQLQRVDHCLDHAPDERNTRAPASAKCSGVVVWLMQAVPSVCHAHCVGFFVRHMMSVVDRLDQEIGDEADDQKPGHDVHGDVIGLAFGTPCVDLVLPDVVHQHRAKMPAIDHAVSNSPWIAPT